jgi:hypothetical protein
MSLIITVIYTLFIFVIGGVFSSMLAAGRRKP